MNNIVNDQSGNSKSTTLHRSTVRSLGICQLPFLLHEREWSAPRTRGCLSREETPCEYLNPLRRLDAFFMWSPFLASEVKEREAQRGES